ncbi:MAG: Transposase [uncultured bacterium]|uniref:Transposase IS200-like domain-containing protein n=4 Tax=Candidatus Daviesiibacteriota TaxID=1752718 RepID=A0A0G0F7H6_9BACT|nr:MAG: Transposase [uncultured bacterium]KKQ09440.1 MAG: hypothetical protein US19_C0014G0012 [Candidatus Daviesbacteria bacterium GW2011_GWB1_36_5]KKQ14924.1 MAG: hypothetical protein US28_C0026G0002 [Candidatus Daviesbacteria bacterium GW2011_GWA1_36_8]OGE17239.1 MAG: hypothetical protein A2858_00860 [Candidatus Daviesbacteria bacterium RIFCSPHIGHO2_01_FULL_36_37]OGE36020.1 MAG: hypothetical protein A3E66_01855 [Candidatus Daviesbacteria bacterium RIFCSPHIGHO2_12_FULL_37_16]
MNSHLINGSYYHVYNRGVEKRTIFQSPKDYYRFLETIRYYRFFPTPRKLSTHINFNFPPILSHTKQNQLVKILCFCLMPNHFHLLIQQCEDNGISEFMRRISDSFTRYFNTKYDRVGPLFQGKFKAKIVETDEYLLQLSKYIHRNPLTLPKWLVEENLSDYTFSSYGGYLNSKRTFDFCEMDDINEYFSSTNPSLSYKSFVQESDEINVPEDLLFEED